MNNSPLALTVYGKPIPQGSKRHVGGGRMIESSKFLEDWRTDVTVAARREMDARMPLEGPLVLHAHFTVPKPVGAPKRRQTWPDRKPDLDKLLRGICDALTAAGAWGDDGQVVRITTTKSYPNETDFALQLPGVRLLVFPLEAQEERAIA